MDHAHPTDHHVDIVHITQIVPGHVLIFQTRARTR